MINPSPIIDFIIGIFFYWYILGGVIMQIVEYLASIGKWRAVGLHNGIRRMLGNEVLTDMLYQHPLILGLYGSGVSKPGRLPSYIPARQFSQALQDILMSADREIFLYKYQLLRLKKSAELHLPSSKRAAAVSEADRILQLCMLSETLDFKNNEGFRNLLIATVEKDIDAFAGTFPELHSASQAIRSEVVPLQERIKAISGEFEGLYQKANPEMRSFISGMFVFSILSPKLGGVLGSLLKGIPEGTNDKAAMEDRFRENAVNWYNDAMDRLSGWYRRKSGLAALSIGILIAVMFNIDSLEFARYLWRDTSLQSVLRSAALSEIDGDGVMTVEHLVQNEYFSIPMGWNFEKVLVANVADCNWDSMPAFEHVGYCYRMDSAVSPTSGWRWLFEKVIGLLVSAIAGSQGASIWFDALQKVVNIRMSGKKPENNSPMSVG